MTHRDDEAPGAAEEKAAAEKDAAKTRAKAEKRLRHTMTAQLAEMAAERVEKKD